MAAPAPCADRCRHRDEETAISEIGRVAVRVEIFDPGFVRARRGVRAVAATVLAWATMAAVTAVFDVADPLRITLFAAGAAFEGALLAPDPQPRDRLRTLGWAAAVAAVALVVSIQLGRAAVWAPAVLLVLLMFLSYALRSWSTRIASLALMAAITVYVTGAGYITVGRIGWFVVALAVGFGWIAVWESVILPDDPLRSLRRSVQAFSRRAADTVADVVDVLNSGDDAPNPGQLPRTLHKSLARVKRCRTAIDTQFPGVTSRGFSPDGVEQLRVALYSAERGLDEMARAAADRRWMETATDGAVGSITRTLRADADALRDATPAEPRGDRRSSAMAAVDDPQMPPESRLAGLTLIGAGALVAESISQTMTLASVKPTGAGRDSNTAAATGAPDGAQSPPTSDRALTPTMALAIQAVVAATAAGLIARLVGNEQSLVVAWTAFVVIGASAGASTRRAWARLGATILGAVGGVLIAACVPDTLGWTVVVVAVGVFFTIVTAPVSYPAMVFWMSIALVPLFATQGSYFDLIRDKAVAAFIGGCVAAVVALTVVPIRQSRALRSAVLRYLDALDAALASHLPGTGVGSAEAGTELDRAHSALRSVAASAASETGVFAPQKNSVTEELVRIDAVQEAYRRMAPLLLDSSRRLHGWTNDRVAQGINRLRDAVEDARTAAGGDPVSAIRTPPVGEPPVPHVDDVKEELADSVWRVEVLSARLGELSAWLRSHQTRANPHATSR